MGRGIALTEAQWDELDRMRLTTDSADVFRNCLIIPMSDSRDTIAMIVQRLGCGTDTVVRIRRWYRQGGIKALSPRHLPGRPSRATLAFLEAMKQAVQTNPLTLGYGFSLSDPDPHVGGGRPAARDSRSGTEQKAGGLWWRQLPNGPDHLYGGPNQERAKLSAVPNRPGRGLRRAEGLTGLR